MASRQIPASFPRRARHRLTPMSTEARDVKGETVAPAGGPGGRPASMADPRDTQRMMFSKGENTRFIRFQQVLDKWPLLQEDWARMVEDTRVSAVDRTPGAATFGR